MAADRADLDPCSEEGARACARTVLELMARRGETLAVAESLTGGLLAATLVDVPGASRVFRGGVVAYATDLKASLLGVDEGLLERHGAVDPDVATAMAVGVRCRLGTTHALATTGVAGPDPQDGHPPGTVFVSLDQEGRTPQTRRLAASGTRVQIRRQTVAEALRMLLEAGS